MQKTQGYNELNAEGLNPTSWSGDKRKVQMVDTRIIGISII